MKFLIFTHRELRITRMVSPILRVVCLATTQNTITIVPENTDYKHERKRKSLEKKRNKSNPLPSDNTAGPSLRNCDPQQVDSFKTNEYVLYAVIKSRTCVPQVRFMQRNQNLIQITSHN